MANKKTHFSKGSNKGLAIFLGLIGLFLVFLMFISSHETFKVQSDSQERQLHNASDPWSSFASVLRSSSKHQSLSGVTTQSDNGEFKNPEIIERGVQSGSHLIYLLNTDNSLSEILDESETYDMNEQEKDIFSLLSLKKIQVKKNKDIQDVEYLGYYMTMSGVSTFYHLLYSSNSYTDTNAIQGFEYVLRNDVDPDRKTIGVLIMRTKNQIDSLILKENRQRKIY